MNKILLTGSNGFVGKAVCDYLLRRGKSIIAPVRHPESLDVFAEKHPVSCIKIEDIGSNTDWQESLLGVDAVVHSAARVHVMNEVSSDPLADFRHVNVDGTLNLARQAATIGVRRFIFISSIGVNGNQSFNKPFRDSDILNPQNSYSISKMEAEQGLREIAASSNMEVVIIRPPLVYGPGVKANFLSMMRWLHRGIPLPLGTIHNKRSLVGLDNLVDLISTCIEHPSAANQVFLVSDGEDLSTTDLLHQMGNALGKPPCLIPMPAGLLKLGASLLGKSEITLRLCGSLQVDITRTRELLGWSPPVSVDEGLRQTAEHFLASLQGGKL